MLVWNWIFSFTPSKSANVKDLSVDIAVQNWLKQSFIFYLVLVLFIHLFCILCKRGRHLLNNLWLSLKRLFWWSIMMWLLWHYFRNLYCHKLWKRQESTKRWFFKNCAGIYVSMLIISLTHTCPQNQCYIYILRKIVFGKNQFCLAVQCTTSNLFCLYVVVKSLTSFRITLWKKGKGADP